MSDTFSSTDDIRGPKPSKHLRSVKFDEPMSLSLGGQLPSVTCAYETFGQLNADRSNAVLICHALSGDSHVTRHDDQDIPGWWEPLVGSGRAINTDRYFVVSPNVLGGCRGTTGPSSTNPKTGRPYGKEFPQVTVADLVDTQARLLDHLGIDRVAAVIGGSLGGHQAITWATRYPDRVAACCAIATSPRLTSQALAFDVIGRNAIQTDPNYYDGQYYDQDQQPQAGLAIARMLGHITYLSSEAMDQKFDIDRHKPRDIDTYFEKRFSVGSYLAHQGHKFVERFDANSYMVLSAAMDLVDFGATAEQRCESLRPATCRWLILSFSSDWLFPPFQSRQLVRALTAWHQPVSYAEVQTDAGHDAFLTDEGVGQIATLIRATINPPPPDPADDLPPRLDDQRILPFIEPGESVLDLGCGDGRLLTALRARGHEHLRGIEINHESIVEAVDRGLTVLRHDLDGGELPFPDKSFDLVILSATLQAVANIEQLLDNMLRVGRRCILSFANFAYRELRDMYGKQGRSPKAAGEYNYDWYHTPNRRFPSIIDVLDLLKAKGATVHESVYLDSRSKQRVSPDDDFNYKADTAILVISK